MAEDLVEVDRRGPVAVVRFNRPDRGNAWTIALGKVFYRELKSLDRDPDVRVIVLTGTGSSFCVGGDSSELDSIADAGALDFTDTTQFWHTTRVRKPVIAAINGGCAGIGLVQALMCDLRFAGPTARLTTAYAKVGLPAEAGVSWVLPRIIGIANAMDLLLSARAIDAVEAYRLGVVNRITDGDVLEEAVAYAQALAATSSPASMAAIKRQVWRDLERGVREASDIADELTDHHVAAEDFRIGVDALQRREPASFPPLPDGGRG